ncbi:MAG TPA: ATP-binding protein [Candidatus Baltobacteraceae bacterium]|jgi:signal transduction histidine kinase/CheY-like chemotaxis protein|nr:ATP-binding protein [Candidatus Baltobacteraceae bacterium]
MPFWNHPKLQFHAKILVPVVAALALFMIATSWLLRSRMQHQFHHEAIESLMVAEDAFTNLLSANAHGMMLQFAPAASEPVFRSVAKIIASAQAADVKRISRQTMTDPLTNIVSRLGQESALALFSGPDGQYLCGVNHNSTLNRADFHRAADASIKAVIEEGTPNVCTVQFQGRVFIVISAPSLDLNNELLGVLTMGMAVGESTLSQLKPSNSDLVFVANDQIAGSTLSDGKTDLLDRYKELLAADPSHRTAEVSLQDEPFVMTAGQLPLFSGEGSAGYLLFSSYAAVQQQIQVTQRILFLGGIFGMLIGTVVVALLVRRVTQPLRDLRDSAEAVGRGDFSKRIEIRSNDELGELGAVFNQMTDNLQKSTAQLEKTVSMLRDTQAKLLHSEKLSAVGQFVAGVAHELNNPLTALIGFSELLQMDNVDDDTRESLQRICVSAERCHKIVQSLLSFARQRPPERKLTNLNQLLDAVIEILIYELRTNNIKVNRSYEIDLPTLLVDPHQTQQVFLNIVNNARQAIEAHRPHGAIHLVTRSLGDHVQVRFEDDGPGMSPETLAKVFDPFFTTKPVGKGTGLGLSLSYGIVQEHGGTINVESAVGKGTTFIIELPVTKGVETGPAPVKASEPVLHGKGKKILAVDDEEDIVDLVRKTLERRGYTVRTALNGESALRHIAHDNFDLIISDWKMPGVNGQQLYERLRQIQPLAAERMIFMTGDVLSEKTERYLQEQNKICLAKPFSLDDFERAVRRTLEAV